MRTSFYTYFSSAYGTIWLALFVVSFVTQSHINTGAFGLCGFPLLALGYALYRRSTDEDQLAELERQNLKHSRTEARPDAHTCPKLACEIQPHRANATYVVTKAIIGTARVVARSGTVLYRRLAIGWPFAKQEAGELFHAPQNSILLTQQIANLRYIQKHQPDCALSASSAPSCSKLHLQLTTT
jgi:hypothetical protein